MRNILALIGAAVVAFLAVGWYLGWYQVSRTSSPGGKQAISVDLNSDKISNDVKKAGEQGAEIVDQLRDKSKSQPNQETGPATNFFTPTPAEKDKGSSGGWRPFSDK